MKDETRAAAFIERAMAKWGAMVYRLALNQMRSPEDADDIAQDVFLKLLNETTDFKNDEHLKAWLLRVTINRCKEHYRSAWRHRMHTTPANDPAFANLEAPVQRLDASDIWEAVHRLPAHQRLVVHLHYFEGYPLEEIARLIHCKPATVRTRLHRARKNLKLDMEQEAEHEINYKHLPLADERH